MKKLTKKKLTKRGVLFIMISLLSAITLTVNCTSNKHLLKKDYSQLSNFKDGVFINPVETNTSLEGSSSIGVMWKMFTAKDVKPITKFDFQGDEFKALPEYSDGLQTMWLGHSTILIEIDGKRFITDPVFRDYASPVQFAGPQRFFKTPITLDELPKLDGVIISHDHYDHLDYATIVKLSKTGVKFYMPLAVGNHFRKWGVPEKQIVELNWWEDIKVGEDHKLTATPARHFSGRGLFDRNETLWASWVIESNKHKVFFGGDSGYWNGFKTIGEKYGPFDLTFLEIGAYGKHWPDIHMGPENAVQANLDLKGKILFPIHWGTFNLAIHKWDDPVKKLVDEAEKMNVEIALPKPGKLNKIEHLPLISNWWVDKVKYN